MRHSKLMVIAGAIMALALFSSVAYIGCGSGSHSSSGSSVPVPGAFDLGSPADMTGNIDLAGAISATGLLVTWTPSANATTYLLEISVDDSFAPAYSVYSPTVAAGITQAFVATPTLAANTLYYWRVRAVNSSGTTDASNHPFTFYTGSTAFTPGSFNVAAPADNASGESITPTLAWTNAASETFYTVYLDDDTNVTVGELFSATVKPGVLSVDVPLSAALTDTMRYYWIVIADGYNDSTSTGLASFVTGPIKSYAITPTAGSVTAGQGITATLTAYGNDNAMVTSHMPVAITMTPVAGVTFYTNNTFAVTTTAYTLINGTAQIYAKSTSAGPFAITITDSADRAQASSAITVTPAAPANLAFVQAPASPQTRNRSWSPAPSIIVTDIYSNTITAYSSAVTIELVSGTGTLTYNSVTPSSGIAAFPAVKYDTLEGITVKGTSGALSSTVEVNITVSTYAISDSWSAISFTSGAFSDTATSANLADVVLSGAGSVWDTRDVAPGNVDAGGALCYPGSGDYIYALQGGLTTGFWRYSISNDVWSSLTGTPGNVGAGGALVSDSGNYIYALGGNSATSFWRYSISGNSWTAMTATPSGVRFGGALCYPGSGDAIYAFRGNTTVDFWSYSISGNSWTSLTAAPATTNAGGSFCYPGSGDYIYAFRGNTTVDFWRYSITGNSWAAMTSTPAAVRYGGSLSYPGSGDAIYALGGNATTNFWSYSITNNAWTSLTATPGSVAMGGAMVYPGPDKFIYALAGNATTSFWRYKFDDYVPSGVYTGTVISPSPIISSWNVLTYTCSAPTNTTLTVDVLDETGTVVLLSDVPSGGSLSSINAVTYPRIRLRANFTTTDSTVTPTLSDWSVSYTYMP